MSISVRELESAIEDSEDWYWDEIEYDSRRDDLHLTIDGTEYKVNVIETDDGGNWDYETYVVFTINGQTFRKTGNFQSHYGNDWDGPLQEVEKVEKTISVWEPKSSDL